MTSGHSIPSVWAIRDALEEIDGALRDEPLPEDAAGGSDPASEIRISDPDRDTRTALVDDPGAFTDEDESVDDAVSDEPAVIFEVAPDLTDAEVSNVLGEGQFAEIRRLHQIRSVDALGWYVTFHQRTAQYGVHIPFEGVLFMALAALAGVPVAWDRKLTYAFHAILRHELFHFAADCMTANWELAIGTDVYWKAKARYRNADGYVEREEALANAYMLRGFKHPSRRLANSGGAFGALKNYCVLQPAGYRDGPRYAKSRSNYVKGCRELSADYQGAAERWQVPEALDTLLLFPDPFRIDWRRCPIIFFDRHDLARRLGVKVDFFTSIPAENITETPKFQKALGKLDPGIRKLWPKRKALLAQSTSLSSLDFKQWKPGGPDAYSMRIDGNYRAHLHHDRDERWSAVGIGSHKDMGHR
jgi:hypothetical protein